MHNNKALLLIDIQQSFMPTGSLPVSNLDKIIPLINRELNSPLYKLKVATKDAHTSNHISFKSWPVYCVKDTQGYEFPEELDSDKFNLVVEKDTLGIADSYSAFYNAPNQPSILLSTLKEYQIKDVYICGVALEFCIKATVEDALDFGFRTFVLRDKVKPIEGSGLV